ncbi:uncharacterized protein SAPINGB_P003284 [Magnusiomyces paraingens]|uniref:t-SNARE affecting a late Golgi compartment protein 1 n=1 Tax=Magnusiomyces paraingens TaxID=2606893 RepID=A0A5E8BK89_9ASCO|nr:uncharacterized protein SAPINGB_P003284 [Saprochaete ingens]VVT52002.1 unnamed protein product [Saprochaete ingens]
MDPFNQVYSDALGQLSAAAKLIEDHQTNPSGFHIEDLNNIIQELVETIHDLSQSMGAIQSQPQNFGLTDHEVQQRISQVGYLNQQLMDLQQKVIEIRETVSSKNNASSSNTNAGNTQSQLFSSNQASLPQSNDDPSTTEINYNPNTTSSLLYQQELENQDTLLDSVYHTVNNLNQQASQMTQELHEQSTIIEDFDRHVDTAQDKLRRGMKRVDWVIRNNQETLSSCCITLLILVLFILLILLIVL